MKIYVTRHGETTYNVRHLCNYDPKVNVPLTEKGRGQARTAREELGDITFDAIFISRLPRTRETAEIITNRHEFIVDKRLDDWDVGELEGKTTGDFLNAMESLSSRPPGGETFEDIKVRCKNFLEDLYTMEYKSVFIVTHASIAAAIIGVLKGLTDEEMFSLPFGNCEIIEMEK